MLHQDAVLPTCPIFYWKCDPGTSVQLGYGIAHSRFWSGILHRVLHRDSHGTAPQQPGEFMDTSQPGCMDVEQPVMMDKA